MVRAFNRRRCRVNQLNHPAINGGSGPLQIVNIGGWCGRLGLGLMALAIVSIMALNAIGGGLSRLNNYQSARAADNGNVSTSSLDDPSAIQLSITNATGGSADGSIVIGTPTGGGIAVGRHTITIETGSSVAGYTVMLRGSGSNADLVPDDFGQQC